MRIFFVNLFSFSFILSQPEYESRLLKVITFILKTPQKEIIRPAFFGKIIKTYLEGYKVTTVKLGGVLGHKVDTRLNWTRPVTLGEDEEHGGYLGIQRLGMSSNHLFRLDPSKFLK